MRGGRRLRAALASESLGWNETFLAKSKTLERGPRALDLLESLYAVGDPLPRDVFHDAFPLLGVDPALQLACAREYQGLPPDPFLKAAGRRLERLADRHCHVLELIGPDDSRDEIVCAGAGWYEDSGE